MVGINKMKVSSQLLLGANRHTAGANGLTEGDVAHSRHVASQQLEWRGY